MRTLAGNTTGLAVALTLLGSALASAQTFTYRSSLIGAAGPAPALTLVTGSSGLGFSLDADEAAPGTPVGGEARILTFLNQRAEEVTVTGVSVSPDATNFVILSETCTGAPIPVGGTCDVEVRFQATDNGGYSATLLLATG